MARKKDDYYGSGEGWLKSALIFGGLIVVAAICVFVAFSSRGGPN